ncbi:MAG: hypothetical protein KGS09_14435 [Nitrospirae bacterium]|nr:hypothetical protein [Nitrospirota bacterium]MDE3040253.1 hypothetical protein [Nitrospirota bacterium]MDE3219026.1 hypothetical protein [Nitrospirota bacterium]
MNIPWCPLARQYMHDAQQNVQGLTAKPFAESHGGGDLHWAFGLQVTQATGHADLAASPGFRAVSPVLRGFTFEAPLDRFWNFSIGGMVQAHASVKEKNPLTGKDAVTYLDWSPTIPFGLRISNFRLTASVDLNNAQLDRPALQRVVVQPQLQLEGDGFIPVSIPVQLQVHPLRDRIEIRGRITNLSLGLKGEFDARLTGDLVITIFPTTYESIYDVNYPVSGHDFLHGDIALQKASVELLGGLSVTLNRVGRQTIPFTLSVPWVIPASESLNQVFLLLQTQVPQVWGERTPNVAQPAPLSPVEFAKNTAEIESAIQSHLLEGTVLSLDHNNQMKPMDSRVSLSGSTTPPPPLSYGLKADSAIFTGHYLAAESFRYAATSDPAALDRVKQIVRGFTRLFDVTTDSVVIDGHIMPVRQYPGILSRTLWPSTSKIDFSDEGTQKGSLNQQPCYYEKPDGGWDLLTEQGSRHFKTYAEANTALNSIPAKGQAPIPSRPPQPGLPQPRLALPLVRPVGTVWYGWGCGADHAVSRDAYVGTMMGLMYAYLLVQDPEVKQTAQGLIEGVLDHLLGPGQWNFLLAPYDRIRTSYFGNLDMQLTFLRIGKAINPQKYGPVYDRYAPASEVIWIPTWFTILDPVTAYYKFNLAQAFFQSLLFLEDQPALRGNYLKAYNLLWRATAHHKNAYFDLVRVLIETTAQRMTTAPAPGSITPPAPPREEVPTLLTEWLIRRQLIRAPSGLPFNRVADPVSQANLWPGMIGVYTAASLDTGVSQSYQATIPLPVQDRIGDGMDYVWQRSPFGVGVHLHDSSRPVCQQTPPKPDNIMLCGSDPGREGPGIDYLLPYWLSVYLGVLPK